MEGHNNNSPEGFLKELLAKADQPLSLFEKLSSLRREEAAKNDKILPRLIFDLSNQYNIDICLLAAKAIDEGANCFTVFFVMQDAIPLLTQNETSLILLLEKFYSGMQNDLTASQQYLPIGQLARIHQHFSRKLLDTLFSIHKPFVMGYISTIFLTFSESNLAGIHSELLSLSNHESIYVVKAAINALSRLPYQLPADQEEIDKSMQVSKILANKNSEDLDIEIVAAMGNLLKKSEEPKKLLLTYAQRDSPIILYQVSISLLQNCKAFIQEKWFKDCFMALSRTSCSHRGILHNLDLILFCILQIKGERVVVQEFFVQWAIKSNFSATSNEQVGTLFPSSIHQLINDKQLLETFITNLLNHDDSKVHHFLFSLTHELSVYDIKDLKLDKEILNNLHFDDLIYICRKVLGYVILNGDLSCSLIFSLLDRDNIDDRIKGLVIGIFSENIGKDYPKNAVAFCNKIISLKEETPIKIETANIIIKTIEEYLNKLRSLPHLKELSFPTHETYQIRLQESRKMSDLMEEAREKSIMRQITKEVPLRYGRCWFTYRDGKYTKPSFLSAISRSVIMPGSIMSHPVTAEMARAGLRKAKRGGK